MRRLQIRISSSKKSLNRHAADTKQILELDHLPAYVDNWNRLGLIEVSYAHFLTDVKSYEWVSTRPEYVRYTEQFQPEGRTMSFDQGILTPTPRQLFSPKQSAWPSPPRHPPQIRPAPTDASWKARSPLAP